MSIATVTKAIVMAAGRGSRMGRITAFAKGHPRGNMHKAAIPVVNRPNICRAIDQLASSGVTDFWVSSHHMAGDIVNVVGHGQRFGGGITVRHVVEFPLRHTALVTQDIINRFNIDESFWVLSGDTSFPRTDFEALQANFKRASELSSDVVGSIGFILRPAKEIINRFTTAVINESGLMESFEEPPGSMAEAERIFNLSTDETIKRVSEQVGRIVLPVNSSIYLMTPRIFKAVPEPKANAAALYDFGRFIFPKLPPRSIAAFILEEEVRDGKLVRTWTDMAYPEDILRANFRLVKHAPHLIPGKFVNEHGYWVGNGSQVSNCIMDAVVGEKVSIGSEVMIEKSIIGHGSVIEDVEFIYGSIIFPFSYINTRKGPAGVKKIENSIIVSKITGGSFIDSLPGNQTAVINQLIAPDIDGASKIEDLHISAKEMMELLSW